MAGAPRPGADPSMKGFIGIAFRVQSQGSAFELIYLRPSNGRAPEQLTRNHSAQYVSDPDFTWERLRKETPGKYESYVDLEPGAWTRMRIEVSGTTARLYVNGASQPCLIVNDLKRGESHGPIALWAHETTEAYFSNLTIRRWKREARDTTRRRHGDEKPRPDLGAVLELNEREALEANR